MVIFMDTSALAKRYIEENGTEEVLGYFNELNRIILSSITPIEISSVFNRRLKEHSFSLEIFNKIITVWKEDQSVFSYTYFDSQLVESAIMIVQKESIKTLDAIQLASAYCSTIDKFITADKALFRAAESVLNVEALFIDGF
ncbi:MAG: type II toxin-antitoxin system VapC family toxin [Spirochaetales bacterium]|nr:type II toxin-antitoxin system VapC family toxin [Spirochaetales bacterium]